MKTPNLKRIGVGGALMGALAFGGCGTTGHTQTWTMNTTDKIPSADGKVKVKAEKNGNTRIKVEVAHLAPPSAVFDQASTYVVWVKPNTGAAQNVGVLKVDDNLKGKLETQTAFKQFQVMVTAEPSANVTVPGPFAVMDTAIVMPS